MIFPIDSVLQLRSELEDKINNGELSEAEAFRLALEADPEDARALRMLALLAEDEDDFGLADQLAWRWLHADPLSHEVFHLIARLLARDPANGARAAAYRALGRQKLQFDPEAEQPRPEPAYDLASEPDEVSSEMEPHRALHQMWTESTSVIEPELVDRVLACGPRMTPLLQGVLNLFGEDLLDDVDDALVIRSIALLGEIGDPGCLKLLFQLMLQGDEHFRLTAMWARDRQFSRDREAASQVLRELVRKGTAEDVSVACHQLAALGKTAWRRDALREAEARLGEWTGVERPMVAVALITAYWLMDGPGSPDAARIERAHAKTIPPEVRKSMKTMRSELGALRKADERKPDEDFLREDLVSGASVYDICCSEFEAAEEDAPYPPEDFLPEPNEPCWCGSGKKYKKCHQAADESGR